ncbi:Peroxisomal sarcosine oxidase [Nymphon striatum]|nr:Peroxisomal sarcosine oxidase [Nymphon striatum]
MALTYPKIVIGGGIIGSFTAYQLAKAGHKTLLLEQYSLPHTNGSSHGGSRVTRKVYEEEFFTKMMPEAFNTWSEVERLAEEKIYIETGVAIFEGSPHKKLKNMRKTMDECNLLYKILNHKEISEKYPQLCFSEDYQALLDPSGGILCADKAVAAVQKLFKKYDGELLDDCTVTNIDPGIIVTVKTTKGDFKTESLVVCSGTWTKKLMEMTNLDLPLQVTYLDERKQYVAYEGKISQKVSCKTSVIQGAVPSPFLFNMITDALKSQVSNITIVKFGDDSAIVAKISNATDLFNYKQVVKNIEVFSETHHLILNADKTKEIIIKNKNFIEPTFEEPLKMKGDEIKQENFVKYLGIFIENKLNFNLQKISVYYWEEKDPGQMSAKNGFPCFIGFFPPQSLYLIPSMEYPGLVKFLRHDGIPYNLDEYCTDKDDDPKRQLLIDTVKSHIPGLKPIPAKIELCKYTVTPDNVCILDYHPNHKNIVIGTGFSGTGFKIAPTVGRILRDLSNDKDPGNSMEPFTISRFK